MTDPDDETAEPNDGERRDRLDWTDPPVDFALELPGPYWRTSRTRSGRACAAGRPTP